MMFSDHGFGRLDTEVYLNAFLRKEGFLNLSSEEPRSFADIAEGTRAFVLDPSRVYLHTEKYGRGRVAEQDRESLLGELTDAFTGVTIGGKPVIRRVYRKEEVFSGPCMDAAPDLVLVEHEGFDLKARLAAADIQGTGAFRGKHTPDDAFLMVRAPRDTEINIPEHPAVTDVKSIMRQADR
jgi:predicted AlkP superfamily phosphohydrolase/phosphomutase